MYVARLLSCVFSIALFSYGCLAQMPEMHHQHAEEKLGTVSFPVSCKPASRAGMERGVALLHSFGYVNAQAQFESIAKSDPFCAMAHWGVAMTQYQELWSQPDESQIKIGAQEMEKARQLSFGVMAIQSSPGHPKIDERVTSRESAYIEALSAFFRPAEVPFAERATAYAVKMDVLHKAFPRDVEAAAFDALAILAAVPPGDTTLNGAHRALAILIPLYAAHPYHPGLAHYIIHTCDTPALAREGLSAAREYAKIAPSSPHALHMPGHIFARLGMWPEDIASNEASMKASQRSAQMHEPGAAHQMHAEEFLVYAYLQMGQDEKARALTGKMSSIGRQMAGMPGMDDMKDAGHVFTNELLAVYAMELHDWKAAAALRADEGSSPYESFDIYWAQGTAAGHLHDAKLAASAVAGLDRNIQALKGTPYEGYFANSLEVKRMEVAGWQALAQDRPDEAVKSMRAAADQQDKLGQDEVDIPAREMLGDLLLLEHKPAEALAEYRTALKLSPNRLNGLLSAGAAAEQANLPEETRRFYTAALSQTSGSSSKRPELQQAEFSRLRRVGLVRSRQGTGPQTPAAGGK